MLCCCSRSRALVRLIATIASNTAMKVTTKTHVMASPSCAKSAGEIAEYIPIPRVAQQDHSAKGWAVQPIYEVDFEQIRQWVERVRKAPCGLIPNYTDAGHNLTHPNRMSAVNHLDQRTPIPSTVYEGTTCRLFVTEKLPGTPLATIPARFLSASLSTTPSSVTRPFFTMIRIGFCTPSAYFSSAG